MLDTNFKCFINIDFLSWVFYCPHFINEKTEAQRSWELSQGPEQYMKEQ